MPGIEPAQITETLQIVELIQPSYDDQDVSDVCYIYVLTGNIYFIIFLALALIILDNLMRLKWTAFNIAKTYLHNLSVCLIWVELTNHMQDFMLYYYAISVCISLVISGWI
jgi:hypothetical protein